MIKPRRILFLIYDGFELIDLSGPVAVFTAANSVGRHQVYEVITVSPAGGAVQSSAGLTVLSEPISNIKPGARDTVLVVGAEGRAIAAAMADPVLRNWLKDIPDKIERTASVCSGAFILAAVGLLDNREATTHWAGCKRLAKMFPSVRVKPDALYVIDGPVWTSAGVTTGIDMALEMVARDHGAALMGTIAKWLVVYAHRPGNQSQFSSILAAQTAANGAFVHVISWMDATLDQPIRLADMAERAGMAERTFRRKFTKALGTSPAKYLENLRLDRAKQLLEIGQSISTVTTEVGYRSEASFRLAFRAKYGISPSMHSIIHARASGIKIL